MKKSRKLPAKYEGRVTSWVVAFPTLLLVLPMVKRLTKAIVAPPEQG